MLPKVFPSRRRVHATQFLFEFPPRGGRSVSSRPTARDYRYESKMCDPRHRWLGYVSNFIVIGSVEGNLEIQNLVGTQVQ